MEHGVDIFQTAVIGIIIIFLIASVVLLISNKIKFLPYTAMLVALGVFIQPGNFAPLDIIRLTPSMVLFIILPILLFESAFNFEFREFKKVFSLSFFMATIGLLISTVLIALPIHFFIHVELLPALLFASVISSTDPIAVLTIFKELGVPRKLQLLVDGESFLNDGTSVILFKIILRVLATAGLAAGAGSQTLIIGAFGNFALVMAGGALIGLILGWMFAQIISSIHNNSSIEFLMTFVLALSSFMIAEHYLHVSGIIAVLAAGLMMGNYGRSKISPKAAHEMHRIWDLLVFVVTSFVFLLIGYEIHYQSIVTNIKEIGIALVAIIIARSLSIYLVGIAFNRFQKVQNRVSTAWMHIANIGGLRGSLPLVIILSLPHEFVYRELFLDLTLGAILFSLIVNASLIKYVIKWLGVDKPSRVNEIEMSIVEVLIFERILKQMDKMLASGEIRQKVYDLHKKSIIKEMKNTNKHLSKMLDKKDGDSLKKEMQKTLDRYCLNIEKSTYASLYRRGVIAEGHYRELLYSIDDQLEQINNTDEIFKLVPHKPASAAMELNRIYDDRASISGIIATLRGRKFSDQIQDFYLYHKSRMIGDERVLQELKILADAGVELIEKSIITAKLEQYNAVLKHNKATLEFIEKTFPEVAERAEECIFDEESDNILHTMIHKYGEEGRVSAKALQSLDFKI